MFGCSQGKRGGHDHGLQRGLGRRGKAAAAGKGQPTAQPTTAPSHADQNGSAETQLLPNGSPVNSTGIPGLQQQSAQQLVREEQTGQKLWPPPHLRVNYSLGLSSIFFRTIHPILRN